MQCTFSMIDGSLEMSIETVKPKTKDKMFDAIDLSWNPVVGCYHNCCYCWAKRLAVTKLKNVARYKDGFKPKLVEEEFGRKFHDKFIFVSDMGDLFGRWVPFEWIVRVIDSVRLSPSSDFLFLTKNPRRYFEFLEMFPKNVVLGATIETDMYFGVADAPSVEERHDVMAELPWKRKLVSMEPIMDFNLDRMVQWIRDIRPGVVYVGYDNYGNKLPEPSLAKTEELITQLQSFTKVRRKTIRKAWWEV